MRDVLYLFLVSGILIFLIVLNKDVFVCNVVDFANNSTRGETMEKFRNSKRFILLEYQDDFYIVYDNLTKVQYAVSSGAYNRGILVLLVDSQGKPLLYEEEENEITESN